ncbi:XRE family transcriptional regulator [Aneurinibacillus migulanus]|uniref:transcriptional repressor LexA n=1 Tax=Aneurinibacillus migulanus TaxID=47500 RepID=UPI0005B84530|nr:transcriptional repressor LexA [Aneurinibacillus migulanus]KIV50611.1 XRE family transcriptional regulator [Aneurinibacillus migulanus]KPD10129.1 XRE family transcriptional regulator [Aneurinibacillus migulanus]
MKKLSAKQMKILNFIKKEVKEKGYPPSVREIAKAVGLASSSTAHGYLNRLEKRGLIRRDPTKPRAIEISDDNRAGNAPLTEAVKTVTVPVIGKVTAGIPITAVENVEEYFVLPKNIVGSDLIYMLRIQGESMIEAGILDDDYVIVRQQNTANNGDIVVAMTAEDEATVKRIFKEKDHIRLQPENSNMAPIILSSVVILGKVIGLYRNIH